MILLKYPSYRKQLLGIHHLLLQVKLFIYKFIHPNPAMVSFKLTNLPFLPEKTSLMKNG